MRRIGSISNYLSFGSILISILCAKISVSQEAMPSIGPAFEVVSVKRLYPTPMAAPGMTGMIGPRKQPCAYLEDRVRCVLSLQGLIVDAFQIKEVEIVGPGWLKEEVFAFEATMPQGTKKDIARLMFQRALTARFSLKIHRERREIPVYALIPGKHGIKLHEPDDAEHRKPETIRTPVGPMQAAVYRTSGRFAAEAISLESLAANLSPSAGLPVVNMTGLTGKYKIDVRWTPTPAEDTDGTRTLNDPEFVRAIQEQLGLQLEKRRAPFEMFVIDHIERVPTEN